MRHAPDTVVGLRPRPKGLLLQALALALPAVVHAQLGSYNPPPGPQGTFAIRNAHVFPVSGPDIQNGTVVISGGKIQAVGANVAIYNGNPLSVYSSVDYTIIDGEVFFSKQKDLALRDAEAKERADLEKAEANQPPARGGRGGGFGAPGTGATSSAPEIH